MILLVGSESMEGEEEEYDKESGSEAVDQHFGVELRLYNHMRKSPTQKWQSYGHSWLIGYDTTNTLRPSLLISLFSPLDQPPW